MRLQVQLYIDTSGDPVSENATYERLDLFDFESISLTSSRQNVREIDKVFTDFSQQFTVPASPNNNKIFSHYDNTELFEGFDARVKQRAYISLNGITFRSGYIRLSNVVKKNDKPYSYRIVFFGEMALLKQVVGDIKIASLDSLSKYNHEYNIDNVYNGFITGLGLSGTSMVTSTNKDIIYPSISAINKWFYDSSGESSPSSLVFSQGQSVNLYDSNSDGSHGIDWLQLKPAIKVLHIIEAIESRFASLNFSRDFFGRAFFNDLYLLLHNTKGLLATGVRTEDEQVLNWSVGTSDSDSDLFLDAAQTELRPIITETTNAEYIPLIGEIPPSFLPNITEQLYELDFTVTVISPASGSNYTIELLEDNEVIDELVGVTGTQTLSTTITSEEYKQWSNLRYRVRSNGLLTTFDVGLSMRKKVERLNNNQIIFDDTSTYTPSGNSYTMLREMDIPKHLPDITVLEFLQGLFKTFNLTSEVDDNGVISVKTLNTYYDDGDNIDITSYVHTDEYSLSRLKLYNNVKFEYQDPKTFGIKKQNEYAQDDYGNLEFQGTVNGRGQSLIFDGDKYEVKLPFEKLFFERLSDEDDLTVSTPFSQGWLADDNQSPVLTKPVLFFNTNTSIDTATYKFGFLGKAGSIATYNRASNTNSDESYSLHFGSEFDEYSGNIVNRSLFKLFYEDYIQNVFYKNSRILKVKAHLPLGFLITYNLNDTLTIRNREYIINSIRTDLTTGFSDLELITKYNITEVTPESDITAPSTPTNVTQGLVTNSTIVLTWTASTDNVGVTGYKIYVDTVLTQTLGVSTQATLTGLDTNTSYDVQVSALDEAGNESTLSAVVVMTTANNPDVTPPTVPNGVTVDAVTSDSVTLSWNASSDNVGVQGYRVFTDGGSPIDVGNVLTYTVTGLSSNTKYRFNVSAYDDAGSNAGFGSGDNESTLSTTVNATTTIPEIT